jgi:protein-disulfide isomerase
MDKRFIVILIILVVGLGGLFLFTRNKAAAPGTNNNSSASVSNHTKGNNASKVSLVVYGDFECSACERFFPIEKQVVDKFINDITFTFRHYPLDTIHQNARAASRAAEAAGKQNKFFEMHDLLYQNQSSWLSLGDPLPTFTKFATALSINVEQFKTDYASEAVNSTINADKKEGDSKKVAGTPTYFLNGKELKLEEIQTVDLFSAKIDAAIKAANNK